MCFFFNDTATTEIYTLSLHDALPILITDKLASYGAAKKEITPGVEHRQHKGLNNQAENSHQPTRRRERQMKRFKSDRKSTRLNSSHANISYAVFCLKKKKILMISHRN